MVIKAEHTLNRVILAGAGGGIAMIAAMFYPLFVDWPRLFVEEWPFADSASRIAQLALAVLIVPVTGYLAARWARVGRRAAGTLFGALSGWIAALTAYVVLVAAASSVAASRAIFDWGLRPALDDPHALWLTAEPVINIVYATYISLWVMQIGGLALGALGGTFAPASTETVTAPELRNAALTISSLVAYVCGSTLSLAAVIFNPLVGVYTGETSSTGKPMAEAVKPYVFSFPPEGVAIIPVASALLLFATSMWVLYLVRAAQRRSGDPVELTGGFGLSVVITLLPVLSGMSVALAGSRPGLLLQTVIVTAVCVLFTVLFGAQTLADLRGRQPGEPLFPEWNPLILVTFGLVLIGMLGSVGTAVFFPPYMNDFYLGLRWGIGALILLVGVLVGAAVYWWFAVRPQGVTLGSWIRSQFSSRNTQPRQLSRLWQGTLNAVTVGFPIALLLVSQVLPAALSMVMLVVTSISVFFSYEKESLSPTAAGVVETGLPNLVQTLYYTQAGAFGTVLLAIFVFIGIILLTMRIREVVVGRMSNRAQQDVNQPEAG